ncbi:MAG: hypothetical protein EPO10_30550, partial [Reyranella sp.]
MSDTGEPQKKGWFARFRRGTPAVETPRPAEPEVEKLEPVEPAVTAEPETQVAPPPIEPVPTAPEPETVPVETVTEAEAVAAKEPEVEKPEVEKPEVEKPEVEKKGWLSRLREGLSKSTRKVAESITGLFTKKKLDQQTLD